MAELDSILAGMLDVAKKVAPFVLPGGAEAIALGESVVKMIDKATHRATGPVPPQLIAERDRIEQSVRDHVKRTASNLRG